MRPAHKMTHKKHHGFTLLEVLISVLVLAFGLLGLAGMQSLTVKNNLIAEHRSRASLVAYDIIDRIRVNRSSVNSYLSTTMPPTAAASQAGCLNTTTACTSAQMAQHDLFEWNTAIVTSLPRGAGTIAVDAAGIIYTVSVNWDVNQDGASNATDNIFTTSFHL